MDGQLLDRARQLVAAGPYDARPAEIAAVHAAIYPRRDAVCQTCPRELGPAFFAIKRWAEQQGAAGDAPTSSPFMSKPQSQVARFKSDTTLYTPHNLGVTYSNANLTNKAARDILASDPDAKELFDVLPPAADDEQTADSTTAPGQESPAAPALAEQRLVPETVPTGFDYKALASAMLDEVERRQQEADALGDAADSEADAPKLTASAGGAGQPNADKSGNADESKPAGESSDVDQSKTGDNAGSNDNASSNDNAGSDSHDGAGQTGEKPVRLSRQTKDQLRATYAAELGTAPAEGLGADELREAIAKHRESQSSN